MKNKTKGFRYFRFLSGLLSLGLVLSGSVGFRAEAAEDYTYQAVFHAGAQGTFKGTDQVEVTPVASEGRTEFPTPTLSKDQKTITVKGLLAGDKVSFDVAQRGGTEEGEGVTEEGAADGSTLAVQLENGSRYYVKGLRKSGRDGSDPLDTTLPDIIDGDLDYVVSYGIRGDMTDYEVRYEDAAGRALRDPRPYTGNVGDRVVATYLDIPGYQPRDAYHLVKTLTRNEAENVLTFVYVPVPAGGTGGGGGGTTVIETVETVTVPGAAAPAAPGGAVAPGGAAPGGPGGGEEIPEEEVPQAGPEEILDLDEGEVPLAPGNASGMESNARVGAGSFYGLAAVAVAGTGALGGVLIWLWRRKRKKQAS